MGHGARRRGTSGMWPGRQNKQMRIIFNLARCVHCWWQLFGCVEHSLFSC
ncbi:hypothetical protein BRI6_0086 [plant metagenome]|uniref:Uncharacterized protein n=1 Tax=plant metagenome TaxID=1297885 RepID=A0A484UYE7_9ZZZZ